MKHGSRSKEMRSSADDRQPPQARAEERRGGSNSRSRTWR
jgi:hypothetical protein